MMPDSTAPIEDQDHSPAPLGDDDLRETLDLLATAVASISDRVDDQTRMLDRVNKTATEARQAAFAARTQTDPEHYGDMVSKTINTRIGGHLSRIETMAGDLLRASSHTQEVLKKAEQDRYVAHLRLREREQRLERFKSRLPWVGLGAVVLVLALAVALPRFAASYAATCAVLGGSWTKTTTGADVCVFYPR